MAAYLVRGLVDPADDLWRADVKPTSHVSERVIDYGVYSGRVAIGARCQDMGPSRSHDFVGYAVGLAGDARGYRWPQPVPLREVPPGLKYDRFWDEWEGGLHP